MAGAESDHRTPIGLARLVIIEKEGGELVLSI
jgi:hypothetical protein